MVLMWVSVMTRAAYHDRQMVVIALRLRSYVIMVFSPFKLGCAKARRFPRMTATYKYAYRCEFFAFDRSRLFRRECRVRKREKASHLTLKGVSCQTSRRFP